MRTLLAASVLTNTTVMAADHSRLDDKVGAAVLGDWPYDKLLLDNASLRLGSVNADRDVSSSQSASKVG